MCTPIARDPVTQKAGFGLGRSNAAITEHRHTSGDEAESRRTREWSRTSGTPLNVAEWELAQIELAKKDPAAFAPLYEAYVDLVWRYGMKRLGNEDRAADTTSQVFIKVIAALPTYKPAMRGEGTTFRSWLMLIATIVAIPLATLLLQIYARDLVLRTLPLPPSTALPLQSLAGKLLGALVAGLIPALTAARASVVQASRG